MASPGGVAFRRSLPRRRVLRQPVGFDPIPSSRSARRPARGGSMAVELDARAAGARRLKDKVCVVTGAGQGIGRATARRLGEGGGKIVVADRIDPGGTEAVA